MCPHQIAVHVGESPQYGALLGGLRAVVQARQRPQHAQHLLRTVRAHPLDQLQDLRMKIYVTILWLNVFLSSSPDTCVFSSTMFVPQSKVVSLPTGGLNSDTKFYINYMTRKIASISFTRAGLRSKTVLEKTKFKLEMSFVLSELTIVNEIERAITSKI